MASWTPDSELAPVAPHPFEAIRRLVLDWRDLAASARQKAGDLKAADRVDWGAHDRLLVMADAYRHCADQLDAVYGGIDEEDV